MTQEKSLFRYSRHQNGFPGRQGHHWVNHRLLFLLLAQLCLILYPPWLSERHVGLVTRAITSDQTFGLEANKNHQSWGLKQLSGISRTHKAECGTQGNIFFLFKILSHFQVQPPQIIDHKVSATCFYFVLYTFTSAGHRQRVHWIGFRYDYDAPSGHHLRHQAIMHRPCPSQQSLRRTLCGRTPLRRSCWIWCQSKWGCVAWSVVLPSLFFTYVILMRWRPILISEQHHHLWPSTRFALV